MVIVGFVHSFPILPMEKHYPSTEELQTKLVPQYNEWAQKLVEESKKRGRPYSLYNVLFLMHQIAQRSPEFINQAEPYVNILTCRDWNKIGRRIQKGAKSFEAVVWKEFPVKDKKTKQIVKDEKGNVLTVKYPKVCHLFGVWQTEEAKERVDMDDSIDEDDRERARAERGYEDSLLQSVGAL